MDTKWTEERDARAVNTLIDVISMNKNRRYYHVRKKFDFTFLKVPAGVLRVRLKRNQCIMAVVERFPSIIRDMHVASGHKGKTKHTRKLNTSLILQWLL